MTQFPKLVALVFLLLTLSPKDALAGKSAERVRMINSFDLQWRFLKADAPGAERPDFDDSAWRILNVPHDWSIEGCLSPILHRPTVRALEI